MRKSRKGLTSTNMGSNSLVPHEMDTRIGVKRIGMHTPSPPVYMSITGALVIGKSNSLRYTVGSVVNENKFSQKSWCDKLI